MGLAVLPYMDEIIASRRKIANSYRDQLTNPAVTLITLRDGTSWNFSYFPILFQNENSLKRAIAVLNENNIFPRRYFYPSLHELPYVNSNEMVVSKNISSRVLCLPLFKELSVENIKIITELINGIFK
jgi:dTDP-4-amino-4,6-dideoxygalactose transaminase